MKILLTAGRDDIAKVYVAETGEEKIIEFVESVQLPIPREKKWVLIVSTLYGCPVECSICDAGGDYQGKISYDEMISQIDYLVTKRYPDRSIPVKKFKIQFARMGEPAFNPEVIKVLRNLPEIYRAPGLIPCISTVAPKRCDRFFEDLLAVKKSLYPKTFQLQFSIHSTDPDVRNGIIPIEKWNFSEIAEYSKRFYDEDGKKITLNFALAQDIPVDMDTILAFFPPEYFFIKITPINPTQTVIEKKMDLPFPQEKAERLVHELTRNEYDSMISIGEVEENKIGSNCGMYASKFNKTNTLSSESYSYILKTILKK